MTASMFQVRAAEVVDAEVMVSVHYASVHGIDERHYSHAVLNAWSPEPDAKRIAWMRNVIGAGRVAALVVARGDSIAGFCLCAAEQGRIDALYVDPMHAGTGAGRALLRACERAIVDRGVLTARVLASLNAVGFYVAGGYAQRGDALQPLSDGSLLACVDMSRVLR